MADYKLTIELVPKSCWYSNVRSNVPVKDWDILRKDCYRKAGYKCEICGGVGKKHKLEAHEIWEYDDNKHIQKLTGIIALCPKCHLAKHIGFASFIGKLGIAKGHLKKVNGMSNIEVKEHLEKVWKVWDERSKHEWELDITLINKLLNKDMSTPKRDGSGGGTRGNRGRGGCATTRRAGIGQSGSSRRGSRAGGGGRRRR